MTSSMRSLSPRWMRNMLGSSSSLREQRASARKGDRKDRPRREQTHGKEHAHEEVATSGNVHAPTGGDRRTSSKHGKVEHWQKGIGAPEILGNGLASVGLKLYDDGAGAVRIKGILPWGSAAFSGRIALHDEILWVADVQCKDMSASQVSDMLNGSAGSSVRLVVRAGKEQFDVLMLRMISHARPSTAEGDLDLQNGSVGAIIIEGASEDTWEVEHIKTGGGAWLCGSPIAMQDHQRDHIEPALLAGDLIVSVDGASVRHVPDAPAVLCGMAYTRLKLGVLRAMRPCTLYMVRSPILSGDLLQMANVYRQRLGQAMMVEKIRSAHALTAPSPPSEFPPAEQDPAFGISVQDIVTSSPSKAIEPGTWSTEPGVYDARPYQLQTAGVHSNEAHDDESSSWWNAPNVASVQAATSSIHADLDKVLANLAGMHDGRPIGNAETRLDTGPFVHSHEKHDQAEQMASYNARVVLGTVAACSAWSSRGSLEKGQMVESDTLGRHSQPLNTSAQTGLSKLYALPQAPRLLYLLREGHGDQDVLKDRQLAAAHITFEDVRLARKVFQIEPGPGGADRGALESALDVRMAQEAEQQHPIHGGRDADPGFFQFDAVVQANGDYQSMLQAEGVASRHFRELVAQGGHIGSPPHIPPRSPRPLSRYPAPSGASEKALHYQAQGRLHTDLALAPQGRQVQGANDSVHTPVMQQVKAQDAPSLSWTDPITSLMAAVAGDGNWWQVGEKSPSDSLIHNAMSKQQFDQSHSSGRFAQESLVSPVFASSAEQDNLHGPQEGFSPHTTGGTLPESPNVQGTAPDLMEDLSAREHSARTALGLYTGDDSPIKLPSGWSARSAWALSAPSLLPERKILPTEADGSFEQDRKALSAFRPDHSVDADLSIGHNGALSARGGTNNLTMGSALPRVIFTSVYRGSGDDRENMDPSAAPVRLPPTAFKPATDQQAENKFIKRVKNMIDAGLSDDQILGHAAMSNSGLGNGDIAKVRAGHLQFLEEQVPDKDPGLSDAVEARVVELLNRGYTDKQIGSHHSLADVNLTDADVAKIRARRSPMTFTWVPRLGQSSAYRV